MGAKLNILNKLLKELQMFPKKDSVFFEPFMASNDSEVGSEVPDDFDIDDDYIDNVLGILNEIKKKDFQLALLDAGKSVSSALELNDLKSKGIGSLIEIPAETRAEVNAYQEKLIGEKDYLQELKLKPKEDVVEEFNLLPAGSSGARVVLTGVLTLVTLVIVFLGYVAYTDERFLDADFGYWAMLLGGIGVIVSLNLLIIWLVKFIKFHSRKEELTLEAYQKFIGKLESDFEIIERKYKTKIFEIERKIYTECCKLQISQFKLDRQGFKTTLGNHFY